MPAQILRFVGIAGLYASGDVAAFDDPAKANSFILSGVAIDAAWDTAGSNCAPRKGSFMAGRPVDAVGWKY